MAINKLTSLQAQNFLHTTSHFFTILSKYHRVLPPPPPRGTSHTIQASFMSFECLHTDLKGEILLELVHFGCGLRELSLFRMVLNPHD
jgi:hypothetical protein